MTPPDRFRSSLDHIASAQPFEEASREIVEQWERQDVALEAVEPVLKFMEDNPAIDYGAPGPLTHFIERFHQSGYDEALLASLDRRPTPYTIWLLNRLINGTRDENERDARIAAMHEIARSPSASEDARASAVDYLKPLEG